MNDPTNEPLMRARILTGGGLLVGAAFITLVLNYSFNVVMSWLLSVQDYGVLAEAQALLLIVGTVLSAGFPWTVARLLSSSEARASPNDRDDASGVIQVGLLGNLMLALALGIGIAIWAFSGTSTLSDEIRSVFVPITLALAVYAVLYLLRGALQGTFRFRGLGALAPVESVVRMGVSLALVSLGFGVGGATLGFAIGAAFATILGVILLRSAPWHIARWPMLGVLKPTIPIFIGSAGLAWVTNIDVLGLGLWGANSNSVGDVGHYQASALMARAPVYAVAALMTAAFPFLAGSARRDEEFAEALTFIGKVVIVLLAPILLVYVLMPAAVLKLLFPSSFGAAGSSLAILSIAMFALSLDYVLIVALQARGRSRIGAYAVVVAVAVQGIALSVLVPVLGSRGAALGTAFGSLAGLGLLLAATTRSMEVTVQARDVLFIGVSMIAFMAVILVLPHGSRIFTVFDVGLAYVAYGSCLVLVPRSNRTRFTARIRSLRVRYAP